MAGRGIILGGGWQGQSSSVWRSAAKKGSILCPLCRHVLIGFYQFALVDKLKKLINSLRLHAIDCICTITVQYTLLSSFSFYQSTSL